MRWLAAISLLVVAALVVGAAAVRHARTLPRFVVAADPAWSPDGRSIAFVASQGGRNGVSRTLYVMRANGSGLRRLTPAGFAAEWPSWSPDGLRIVFGHSHAPENDDSDLYLVDTDGAGLRLFVRHGQTPAWSPRGRRIAYSVAPDGPQLVTVSPSGRNPSVATSSRDDCVSYTEPAWSRDGEQLAFAAEDPGGECSTTWFVGVTRGQGGHGTLVEGAVTDPDWSPGDRLLAVATLGYVTPPARIGVFDVRRRRLRLLRSGSHPRWSPDGRKLVFVVRDENVRSRLALVDADGTHLRFLTR